MLKLIVDLRDSSVVKAGNKANFYKKSELNGFIAHALNFKEYKNV